MEPVEREDRKRGGTLFASHREARRWRDAFCRGLVLFSIRLFLHLPRRCRPLRSSPRGLPCRARFRRTKLFPHKTRFRSGGRCPMRRPGGQALPLSIRRLRQNPARGGGSHGAASFLDSKGLMSIPSTGDKQIIPCLCRETPGGCGPRRRVPLGPEAGWQKPGAAEGEASAMTLPQRAFHYPNTPWGRPRKTAAREGRQPVPAAPPPSPLFSPQAGICPYGREGILPPAF